MGGNVLFTIRSPTAMFFACKLMTFLISNNNGAHRFRYFVAVLVCDFSCHLHDRQRSCLLVHDVADLRPKGQSVADNHGGMVGEALLTVQNAGKVDLQSLEELKRLLGVHHFEAEEISGRETAPNRGAIDHFLHPLVERDHAGAAKAEIVLQSVLGAFDLRAFGAAAQLPCELVTLSKAGRAERMSLG